MLVQIRKQFKYPTATKPTSPWQPLDEEIIGVGVLELGHGLVEHFGVVF